MNARVNDWLDFSAFRANLDMLWQNTGKTRAEFSEACGVSTAALGRYAMGTAVPDVERLYRLAKYFNVSMDWLLGLSQERNNPYSEDVSHVADLYSLASESDKEVIHSLLKKYEH